MNIIFENENDNVKREFCEKWKRYVTAILTYSDHLGRETSIDASSTCVLILYMSVYFHVVY